MPVQVCELNQVSIMTTVKHGDFFLRFRGGGGEKQHNDFFGSAQESPITYPFSLDASRMGRETCTQPAACNKMVSVDSSPEREAR